ncbi:hypothetical protein OIU84_023845 [Salix udensis]|uniref:Uncharacterized protein n=1 Tax=Salix udensis TaxID=889485 RepID=A0AAD6KRR5_9ROSI|nr:hypothetical protein OIU84_023845 [Salix udensis]
MGNPISCLRIQSEPPAGTIKLIRSDGMVKIYDRPIYVSELMLPSPPPRYSLNRHLQETHEFLSQLMEEGKVKESEEDGSSRNCKPTSRVCTTPQLEKDYTQLVGSRQWKPKLETIRESGKEKVFFFIWNEEKEEIPV